MEQRCTHCGSTFQAQSHQGINVALDPSLKQRVKDGSLFIAECPYCGTRNLLTYPVLYHDPQAKLMIWLLPGGGEVPQEVASATEGLDGYTLRLAESAGELIEKVNIADAGLDDAVVEMCKWVTRRELGAKTTEALNAQLRFLRVEGADNDLVLAFPQNGQMNLVNIGFNVYEDASAIIARNPSLAPGKGFARVSVEEYEKVLG